eukprot:TRINITY_DN62743_c0_g1_i1.p2 TRINITY_DN62743_c0_g1~~TRINITY_DN62743_c0_g1_i1.p2  ORF type:complete len:328 (+),score=95.34 TRINITY_DN62743_c0_g1_i1:102-986(+)
MEDELSEVRDNFYAGNFQKAMEMSQSAAPSNDLAQTENDALFARCCLAIGQIDKLKTMQNSPNPGQKASALMALMSLTPKEQVKAQAKEHLLKLATDTQDMTTTMLAAIVTAGEGSYTEAVKMAQAHPTLEMQALCVFICLICNQASMAERMLQEMSGQNDDSVAYRLAQAAVKLVTGDPEEAYLIYCDLSAQFPIVEGDDSGSVLLLCGKGVANMMRGMWTEAIEDLQRAHERAPNDADVLINLCCCDTNLGKKDDFNQHFAKLAQAAPAHPYVVKTQGISQVFAKFKASLAV